MDIKNTVALVTGTNRGVVVPSFRRWWQRVPAKFMLQREMSTV